MAPFIIPDIELYLTDAFGFLILSDSDPIIALDYNSGEFATYIAVLEGIAPSGSSIVETSTSSSGSASQEATITSQSGTPTQESS